MKSKDTLMVAVALASLLASTTSLTAEPAIRAVVHSADVVELSQGRTRARLRVGDRFGAWTLMAVLPGERPQVALEDFTDRAGRLTVLDASGDMQAFEKSLEPSYGVGTAVRDRTVEQIAAEPSDILATEQRASPKDPSYSSIAALFPPIQKIRGGTFTFIGTPDTEEKIGFSIGGRTAYFDPAVFVSSIRNVREAGTMWHGLVGSYLPIVRFVYPHSQTRWTELIAFAPFRIVNGNKRAQPAWYRVVEIDNGNVRSVYYVDTYLPFPPREQANPVQFYADLLDVRERWNALLALGMSIDVPDARMSNLARFSLIQAMLTRAAGAPKYGAVDKDYGGSEHEGFPDTFNVETTAMTEWGLLTRSAQYIDNYFKHYVRDDGSILYRGPETGQYGRMLTVLAQFANAGGDRTVLATHQSKIDAIVRLLLTLRARALTLPAESPSFGMISGWSEADSAIDPEPSRYMQPYFSNSLEAARGFRDLGRVYLASDDVGQRAFGERLVREADALRRDVETAIRRSTLTVDNASVIPAIAGVTEPFDVAVERDRLDPQHRSYRAYMEMLYSGLLDTQQVRSIVDYRASHYDVLLGVPTAYGVNTREIAGFLLYGHFYGLIQHDFTREALLAMYSDMAHQYTRGGWIAPETRRPMLNEDAAPYCTPAQLIVPLVTRWLLVFEDPQQDIVWLGKAMPRDWLEDGQRVRVDNAATRWGRLSFSTESQLKRRTITVQLNLPTGGLAAETRLRLRAPLGLRMRSVTVDGEPWRNFDATAEYVALPPNTPASTIVVRY